jgi:hypothetical protein
MVAKRWVSIAAAVGVLGISERQVRRRVAAGTIEHRRANGRVEVRVDDAMTGGGPDATPDKPTGMPCDRLEAGQATPDATGGPIVLAVITEAVAVHRRQAELAAAELRRVRGWAAAGWGVAAAAFVLAGVGAVWGVRAVEQARGSIAAADASGAVWRAVAERELAERQAAGGPEQAVERQAVAITPDDWAGIPFPVTVP